MRARREYCGPMIVCPACGSDRLIPLTFGSVLGNDRTDLPRRPVAKCADCGKRTYVTATAHRALSSD
jgi:DNA-directed RNA polymerase subunit RPC12/RpoP